MILVDKALQFREDIGNPIRVGIIGAGYMAIGLTNQIFRYVPGMEVVVICNRTIDKAIHCYRQAGAEQVNVCETRGSLEDSIAAHQPAVTTNPNLVCEAEGVDIIVEATGTIEYAARMTLNAVRHKKPVILLNAELDATLGPVLKHYADKENVILSGSDGDQPGVIMNLYRFVKSNGLTPLVCGNIKGFLDFHKNPDDMREYARKAGQNVNMITNFTDGTKIAFEQASVANATGMKVAQRGMMAHRSDKHIDDLIDIYDIEQLKALGGVVDYVVGPQPGPGIYVYAYSEDPVTQHYLDYLKLGKGPLYSFYTPYHLCFFEVPNSIARVFQFNDAVMAPKAGPVVEVATTAKKDMKAGEKLDGFGGYTAYGQCENTPVFNQERLLPIGLCEGLVLKNNVRKDQVLTFDDVIVPKDSFIFNLYKEQQHIFATRPVRESAAVQ